MTNIERVGVVGAGQMGAGIAEVSLKAGVDVVNLRTYRGAGGGGPSTASRSRWSVASARASSPRPSETRRWPSSRRRPSLADLADRDLVIEAIVEDEAVKAKVFAQLDEVITDPDAVLASNTSSIPIMKIAAATKNPGRVLGLHFFNPVPVLPLVELVGTLVTTDAADASGPNSSRVTTLGKKVVRCGGSLGLRRQRAAGAVPTVGHPDGRRLGVATVEDIDTAIVAGLSHPMGPLRLADLDRAGHHEADRGLDVRGVQGTACTRPPPLLQRMVEAGSTRQEVGQGLLRRIKLRLPRRCQIRQILDRFGRLS